MSRVPKKKKKLLTYLVILLVVSGFLFANQNILESVKMGIVQVVASPMNIILIPLKEIKKLVFYHSTFDRYQQLQEEVEMLRSRLLGQEESSRENSRFRELLNFRKSLVFSSVPANVIGRDPSNWESTVIIDKGEMAGVKKGMPVVTALGVVGKIAEVGKTKSKVMLLNDPNFSVAAIVERSREQGLVSGTLQGICRMRYLSSGADVTSGDVIITSKISSSFPEGVTVGKVVRLNENPSSPTLDCFVEPAVSLSKLEEVLVIKK